RRRPLETNRPDGRRQSQRVSRLWRACGAGGHHRDSGGQGAVRLRRRWRRWSASGEEGSGGGGGGGALISPVGYIEVRDGTAQFKRISTPWDLVALVVAASLATPA